jgi:ABC-type antimicrobial peptide transport system permease subunit
MGVFAALALALAALGVYGLLSFTVRMRTAEMGIRIALGARRGQVVRLVLRQALVPVAAGVTAGFAAAVLLSLAFEDLLFAVQPGDPLTMISVAAILGAVALIACGVPAIRATRVDPIAAMRLE